MNTLISLRTTFQKKNKKNKVSITQLPPKLQKELRQRLSLIRLAKTGFFKKAEIPHISIEGELLLHRSVLDKALIDSFSPDEEIREDVEDWLDLDNPDFIDCCEFAMLEPEGVYAAFKTFKSILRGDNAKFKRFGIHKTDDKTTT